MPSSPYNGAGKLADSLATAGYLADPGLATAGWLALRLGRPLFLEGDAGVGKTSFAVALAEAEGVPLIRLQCYEGLDAAQALYDWDFPRQILHLRTMEAVGGQQDPALVEAGLYDRRFLVARPLLRALESAPCVLLIDEIDRADDEFEAYLLELLGEWAVTIPELGRVTATIPPTAVITSNRTREVHDALKRRCLYHWVEHPSPERELAILRVRAPDVTERVAAQITAATNRLRRMDLVKPPGVAEAIDWALALHALGVTELDGEAAALTIGAVVKVREDAERVREMDWAAVASSGARAATPSGGDAHKAPPGSAEQAAGGGG
ncbi:MAG TPA: MoxR family ATPase [Candidatus Limnocylindrales bacterium]